jgi:hypothetical protein
LGHHGEPAATVLGRVQGQQRGQAVPGAAQCDALADAGQGQDRRRPKADGLVAGDEGHGDGRGAQQEQGGRQLGPAAELAVHGDEDQRAQRPGQEGQGEDREGEEGAADRPGEREDQLREHHHRSDGVYEEVEEFRRSAYDDADGDFARIHLAMPRVDSCGVAFQGFRRWGRRGGHELGSLQFHDIYGGTPHVRSAPFAPKGRARG